MEALVWGFAFTYVVFQDYYSTLTMFQNSNNIAIIGTCAMVSLSIPPLPLPKTNTNF